MDKFNEDTCFLFADPSFLTGFATVLDAGGTLVAYNQSQSPQEADARALASDWAIIGRHILLAAKSLKRDEEVQAQAV